MPDASELLALNREVFGERDAGKRRAAIERTYTEDVRFIDPDAEIVGWEALDDRAGKILAGAPTEFVLEADGLAYVGSDTAVQAWRFGAPGNPAVRGIDILELRDGLVSAVRTLVRSETDG